MFYRQNSQRLPILPMKLLRIHIQIVAKKTVVVLLTVIATKKSHDFPAGSPLKIHGFPMLLPSFWIASVLPRFWQNAAALYCCSVSWAMRMSKALPVLSVEQRWFPGRYYGGTVDGGEIHRKRWFILLFIGFQPSKVKQDFATIHSMVIHGDYHYWLVLVSLSFIIMLF